jgi:hypothetical protein
MWQPGHSQAKLLKNLSHPRGVSKQTARVAAPGQVMCRNVSRI